MQRVLRLVVVAGLAMCLPTAVRADESSTGSMEGVSCNSDGHTIETTSCWISGFQGGRGDSDVSDFLNTYVGIHSDDKGKPFWCANRGISSKAKALIYVDDCFRVIKKLPVPNLTCKRDTGGGYYLYSQADKSIRCADVVNALKALSHDTTKTPKTTTTFAITAKTTTTTLFAACTFDCQSGSKISGTANVLLSNGKTAEFGWSHATCQKECEDKPACKSYVYGIWPNR